jgi:hypothetical protein
MMWEYRGVGIERGGDKEEAKVGFLSFSIPPPLGVSISSLPLLEDCYAPSLFDSHPYGVSQTECAVSSIVRLKWGIRKA